MTDAQIAVHAIDAWLKEGAACRDKTGAPHNPYPSGSLAYFVHVQGWLTRDLQLCLCRANPAYRRQQLAAGNITQEGIEGAYGFEPSSPFVEVSK